jgi:rare lipoprotein A
MKTLKKTQNQNSCTPSSGVVMTDISPQWGPFRAVWRGTLFFLLTAFTSYNVYSVNYTNSDNSSYVKLGEASWYSSESCKFNPSPNCPTASGESLYELERKGERFAAMWDVPFGRKYRVTNLANGKSTVVTVCDRGPNRRLNREIDLSKNAFSEIANINQGIIKVSLEVL